jgi:hypothetical protein
MSFTYNTGVPATNNDPSIDQPQMLNNTIVIDEILDVDHITFNADNGGKHRQNTYPDVTTQGTQLGLAGVGYTIQGTANTGAPQWSFKNSISDFTPTTMRAWAFCNNGGIVNNQKMNVDSVVRNAAGNYTVTLKTNAVTGTDFGVLVSCQPASGFLFYSYTILAAGSFRLFFGPNNSILLDPTNFTFQVFQI